MNVIIDGIEYVPKGEIPPLNDERLKECSPQELGNGVYYGGRGPCGEYYSAEVDDLSSESLWATQEGQNVWTLERLKLVVAHMEANSVIDAQFL